MRQFLLVLLIFLISSTSVFADSTYVLPYPSYMPGNFLYNPRAILAKLASVVYFGDFGKFDYSLKESDHYLVEAKTLFEYEQYLLGVKALERSDYYFSRISPNLENARKNKKKTFEREKVLKDAALRHKEVLIKLEKELPEEFRWKPEKSEPTVINFTKLLSASIALRNKFL